MAQYLITYFGGKPPASPEEGKAHFDRYMAWLTALGESAVSPANPLKGTHTLHPDGSASQGSGSGMSGFTVIEADSQEAALAAAADCPFLEIGGTLEVAQMVQMSADKKADRPDTQTTTAAAEKA